MITELLLLPTVLPLFIKSYVIWWQCIYVIKVMSEALNISNDYNFLQILKTY